MDSVNQTIGLVTLLGATMITISDAPEWRLEPYIGLMAAMAGVSILAKASPALAKSFAVLVGGVLVLERGEAVAAKIEQKVR